jgi:hypothetical protein
VARRVRDADCLDETLAARDHGGATPSAKREVRRQWIRAAKGDRRLSDLQLILEVFERAAAEGRAMPLRGPGLPISGGRVARALWDTARLSGSLNVFRRRARAGRRRSCRGDSGAAAARAPRALAETMIDAARRRWPRASGAHAFAYRTGRRVGGDAAAVSGPCSSASSLISRALGVAGFLALKNGVPVSYGGGWEPSRSISPSTFRIAVRARSRRTWRPSFCARRFIFGMRTVVIAAPNSHEHRGAALWPFYFYHRFGFCPRDLWRRTHARSRSGL